MLTRVTLELDNLSLNTVLAALEAQRQVLAHVGASISAQAQAQVAADAKREAKKKPPPMMAALKPNGHAEAR